MAWPFDTIGTPPFGTDTTDYRRQTLGYDPKAALWAQLASALQQAGASIATAPRGQAVGQGLLGVLKGTQQGQQNYESGLLDQYKWKEAAQEDARKQAMRDSLAPLGGAPAAPVNPVPFNTNFDAAGITNQPAGDSGADATANPNDPFADLPTNVRLTAYNHFLQDDPDGAWKIIDEYRLKGGPQLPGKVGEFQSAKDKGIIPSDMGYEAFLKLGDAAQATPAEIQIYNLAVAQGYKGGIEQWKKEMAAAGSSTTNVNIPGQPMIGTIPPGFQVVKDPATGAYTMSPIPGGPAAAEQQAAADKERALGTQQKTAGDVVLQDIGRTLDLVDQNPALTTGFGGTAASYIPGSASYDVSKLLDGIKSNVAFDRLQQMRAASPTGGALGAVTERELTLLSSALGSLEQSQSGDQFKANLRRLKNIYMDAIYGTPEQIKALADAGTISPDVAAELSKREPLGFDAPGGTVNYVIRNGELVPQ